MEVGVWVQKEKLVLEMTYHMLPSCLYSCEILFIVCTESCNLFAPPPPSLTAPSCYVCFDYATNEMNRYKASEADRYWYWICVMHTC